MAELHPSLEPFAKLVGTWRGRGTGVYPTIQGFEYLEEVTFIDVGGKPFLTYTQRTRDAFTDTPLHTETGYLRPGHDDRAEWVISQPTGIGETLVASPGSLEFESTEVTLTPSAKPCTGVRRLLTLDGDTLTYEVHMAAVGEPMQLHLRATLSRVT